MDEINIVEFWILIKKRKLFITLGTLLVTLGITIYTLFMPNIYRAQAVILPLSQRSGLNLGAAFGGLFQGLGGTGNAANTELIAILKSQSLAEEVISGNGFEKKMFDPPLSVDKAATQIRSQMKVIEDASLNTLAIQVENPNPEYAAQIVDAYIKALEEKTLNNTYTKSRKNRIFIEGQLNRNRVMLLESGKVLSDLYASENVSNASPYKDISIGDDNLLKNTKLTQDVEEDKKLQSAVTKTQLVKNVPDKVYLEYLMLNRQSLFEINGLLMQQFEMAKIEESKEDLGFQILDKVRVPKFKIKPVRTRIAFITLIISFLGCVFLVFVYEYINENAALYKAQKADQKSV